MNFKENILKYLLSILLSYCTSILNGQESKDFFFVNIHKENNLVLTFADCIAQDEEGYIWFEYDGLTRFDGNKIVTYAAELGEKSPINSNSLSYLLYDEMGSLWVSTKKGLSKFNTNTHAFTNYYNSHPNTIGSHYISCLCLMNENSLFIGTSTFGAYILDTKTNNLKTHLSTKSKNALSSNHIYKIVKTPIGKYWIATDQGLNLYDPDNQSIQWFLQGESVRDILRGANKNLWVSGYHNKNILELDSESGQLKETHTMPLKLKEKQKKIMIDSEGLLWIAALDMGLYLYNSNKKQLYEVKNSNNIKAQSFPNPTQVFEDEDENIWVTTFSKGLYYLDRSINPFLTVKNSKEFKNRTANSTRYVYQDEEGILWTSSREFAMLSKYDPKIKEFENYMLPPSNGNNPESDLIWYITDGFKENLFLGTIHNGLVEFDKRTGQFKKLKFDPKYPDGIKSNSVYAILVDSKNNIWIGYSKTGLDKYNPDTGEITHYNSSLTKNYVSNNSIRCIYEDKNGEMWVGTLNGLNKLDPKSNRFSSFFSERDDPKTLTDNAINDVFEDSGNNLWIATASGFDKFDRASGEVVRYTQEDGYAFRNTFKILEDSSGNLWLNGERGLSKFNVLTEEFQNFTKSDGLQNSVYFHNGAKLKNGNLVFGGDVGLNIFDADDAELDKRLLETRITGFKLFNEPVQAGNDSPLTKVISKTDTIQLTYKDKVITIEFGALCFSNPEKVEYAYRLKGFEGEWNYVTNQRMATYTNLRPGDYTFEVKAAKNGLFNNAKIKELFISITPPFWKTWWAFVVYMIIIITGMQYYRVLLLRKHEKLRNEEMEQERLKFFINISHEFRTPLTLMINPLHEVSQDLRLSSTLKEKISVAYKSAQKLLQLVTQLQGIRKLEFEKIKLQVRAIDVVEYVKNHSNQFVNLANKKGIDLGFKSDLKKLKAYVDVDKLEKILNNLISNSLKYTNEGGVIQVSIETGKNGTLKSKVSKAIKDKKTLRIIVEDSGIGISKDQLESIFNRFYQANTNSTGAGIGLNYVKSLVDRHHGEIWVKSNVGTGTKFVVSLPYEKQDYYEEEIDKNPDSIKNKVNSTIIDALEYDLSTELNAGSDGFSNDSRSESLLLVEDNKALLSQLKSYLQIRYKVITAKNGEEGLQKAIKNIPDLIISDVMMPIMDGVEMCTKIKQTEEVCNIPIIMLTAKDLIEDRIMGLETGADAYMSKPFYMEELEVQISNLIAGRRRLQEQFKSKSILSDLANENYENKDEVFLNNVTNIVIQNIDKTDFSVKDICEILEIGNSQLFNKLTKLSGQNPSRFIRAIRLKYSLELLQKEGMTIKEVCYQAGFNSPPYFTKVFTEFYGCSPTEYIKKNKFD